MGKAVLQYLLVRHLQSLDQRGLRIVAAKVAIHGHQRFHRQPARFLTAFVAAHAVRYNRQPPLAQELLVVLRLPIAKRILVILAHAADVGLARYFNSGAHLHPITTWIAGMTSIGNDRASRRKLRIIRVAEQDAQTDGLKMAGFARADLSQGRSKWRRGRQPCSRPRRSKNRQHDD